MLFLTFGMLRVDRRVDRCCYSITLILPVTVFELDRYCILKEETFHMLFQSGVVLETVCRICLIDLYTLRGSYGLVGFIFNPSFLKANFRK